MKTSLFIFGFVLLLTFPACKDKNVLCIDIGQNLKNWTVYNPGDSISMHDQQGNHSLFVLSDFENKPAYNTIEKGGLLKKQLVCIGSQRFSNDTHFFDVTVGSTSEGSGETRYPRNFNFEVRVGDAVSEFSVTKENGIESAYVQDLQGTIDTNYISGNATYPEVYIGNWDTLTSNVNVYRFVYAKNKGLIEFSTKNPKRNWVLD